ncbi:MAG: hypothetical protein Kow00105_06950 [Phycisphaeraceae bacterium]
MGYVFDAMNRDDDERRKDQPEQTPSNPTPLEPDAGFEESPCAETPSEPVEVPFVDETTNENADISGTSDPTAEVTDENTTDDSEDTPPVYDFNEVKQAVVGRSGPVEPDSAKDTGPNVRAPLAASPLRITPQWSNELDDRLVSLTEPSSQLAEEYRAIRTSLLARWDHRRHLVHTITSATPQEGKTITSLNLGLSLAELRNRKTIVIEADLRLPTFNKLMHLDDSAGMIGYLRGEAKLNDVIQQVDGSALHVITAGGRASNDAVQLLSNNRMAKLLDILRNKYDHVIIDTPPVIELADAGILGGMSDEVMLIARISRTPKPLIEQALRALRSYNAPVAEIVATDHERGRNRYHYYRYGYRYRYRYYAKRAA